jgi:hypothetical protein
LQVAGDDKVAMPNAKSSLLLFPFDSDRGRTVNIARFMIDQLPYA